MDELGIEELRLRPAKLRVQQAQLLNERAWSSGLSVFALVCLNSLIQVFIAAPLQIAIWFAAATLMIGVTLLLPWGFRKTGINAGNARSYLAWHTTISFITGLVWGLGAARLTDPSAEISIFTTSMMILGITLGGISPQSAYRRSYVALATSVMLPYAAFLLFWAEWPMSAIGGGVLLGYAFFLSSSARVEAATKDALAVKSNQQLVAELKRQRDELQKISEDKTRFLAATSHDLAQPLHAQGFFVAAMKEQLTDPVHLDLLAKIESSWRGIGNLLDGLVDVSRLDAGAIIPDFREVEIASLAIKVFDEYSAAASEKKIEMRSQVLPAHVRTDPILIGRVLRNLISNAVKFTEPGGHIVLTVAPEEGQRVLISIEDSGCGIAIDQHEAIFDEYVQLGNRERNREKGLGLGLSIVRRLTALLNIDLTLKSTRGVGTTFFLKMDKTSGSDGRDEETSKQSSASGSSIGNLSVVIVDDEDAIRTGMSTLLSGWGAQVYSAASGDDLIELLNHIDFLPDVLVVDQRLKAGETGLEVIEKLRDEVNEEVPVVLMTGDISLEEKIRKMGGIHFLQKPVEPNALRELLSLISNA